MNAVAAACHESIVLADIDAELDWGARRAIADGNVGLAVKSLRLAVSQLTTRWGPGWVELVDGAR